MTESSYVPIQISITGRFLKHGVFWISSPPLRLGNSDRNVLFIEFEVNGGLTQHDALEYVTQRLIGNTTWLKPIDSHSPADGWILDLDEMRHQNPKLLPEVEWANWIRGRVVLKPRCVAAERERTGGKVVKAARVWFEFPPNKHAAGMTISPELQPCLETFICDYPNPKRCGFVMMRFDKTGLHKATFDAVTQTCKRFGISALRADAKYYSDELLPNIRTYMHGCGFGIAIFDRLTTDDFNPNVSLEVGYMMALGKSVFLLKDATLKALHTDLVGRLYESFDPQNPATSIPALLERWLRTKELIA